MTCPLPKGTARQTVSSFSLDFAFPLENVLTLEFLTSAVFNTNKLWFTFIFKIPIVRLSGTVIPFLENRNFSCRQSSPPCAIFTVAAALAALFKFPGAGRIPVAVCSIKCFACSIFQFFQSEYKLSGSDRQRCRKESEPLWMFPCRDLAPFCSSICPSDQWPLDALNKIYLVAAVETKPFGNSLLGPHEGTHEGTLTKNQTQKVKCEKQISL